MTILPTEELDERVKQLYKVYFTDIQGYVSWFQIVANEFSVAVLNEIRDIFTHLSRYHALDLSVEKKKKEIERAESHVIRAKLDCFKFYCLAIDDKIEKFDKMYESVDLSYVRDGKFLTEFQNLYNPAHNQLINAKTPEANNVSDIEAIYGLYESACKAYKRCYELITDENVLNSVNFHKQKVTEKGKEIAEREEKAKRLTVIGIALSAIGVVLTLIGLLS
jgi:NADH:ubiquinone oxidoreductase subunit C